jgi:hypothetical protein
VAVVVVVGLVVRRRRRRRRRSTHSLARWSYGRAAQRAASMRLARPPRCVPCVSHHLADFGVSHRLTDYVSPTVPTSWSQPT